MTAPIPEVRQCQDATQSLFGSVAVRGAGTMTGQWGVMSPSQGGHWGSDDDVADWAVLYHPPNVQAERDIEPEPVRPKRKTRSRK